MGTTYSTFTMATPRARASAIAELESLGYTCSVDDGEDGFVIDVDHPWEASAAVRCLVLRADPSAAVRHR
jgi:hypothetical protein